MDEVTRNSDMHYYLDQWYERATCHLPKAEAAEESRRVLLECAKIFKGSIYEKESADYFSYIGRNLEDNKLEVIADTARLISASFKKTANVEATHTLLGVVTEISNASKDSDIVVASVNTLFHHVHMRTIQHVAKTISETVRNAYEQGMNPAEKSALWMKIRALDRGMDIRK